MHARTLTLTQSRALDAQAFRTFRVDTRLLMENAGAECARVVHAMWLRAGKRRANNRGAVAVFCGSGGNGGDGYVCARHLLLAGVPVVVHSAGAPRRATDAASARAAWRALAARMGADLRQARRLRATIAVDAVLGTGVSRPVDGAAARAVARIDELRAEGARIVSIDLPSGLDTDTGKPHGAAVRAHITIAIAALKVGLQKRASAPYRGRVITVPFGAPAQLRR